MTPTSPATVEVHPWQQAARRTAWVAGVYCAVVVVLLLTSWLRSRATDPINNPELIALKAQLTGAANADFLKTQIRALDLRLRDRHLHYVARVHHSGWLLFGAALVLLPALHFVIWKRKPQRLGKFVFRPEEARRAALQARWAVGALGLVIAGTAWLSASNFRTLIPAEPPPTAAAQTPPSATNETALAASPAPVAPVASTPAPSGPVSTVPTVDMTSWPTPEEVNANWPRFRGPRGDGVSAYTNVPLSWNLQTGEGIVWKAPVPLAGPSSPVVWGNRLFLTSATPKKNEIYCYDALTGKLLWQKPVQAPPKDPPSKEERELSSYAAGSAATDGRRVYAMFANGDVAAFDFQGNVVWAQNLGTPDNAYGHTASLVVHQGRLIIQMDQGADEKEGKSRLLALDALTGKEVWKSEPRPVVNSWSSPIVIRAGENDLIIACGNPWLMAYRFTNGVEVWRAKVLGGEVAVSPIYSASLGLVFSANEGEKASALKPDGTGDVTKTKVLWQAEDGLPDICSPLCDGRRFYLLSTPGNLTCYDGPDGKKLWEKDLEMSFKASPSLVGDRIYLINDKGLGLVLQAGPEFKELARSDLSDEVMASPAFADGRIYLRTKLTLYCLGKKAK